MKPAIWKSPRSIAMRRGYPLMTLFDEVNRFFEDSWPTSGESGKSGDFVPKLDVKETQSEFVITGEFPGMRVEEISIELSDNSIMLSGEKRSEHKREEGDRVYVERDYGSFIRRIPFNVEVDEDKAAAEMKNGILTITVPKSVNVVKGTKKLSIRSV